jgi:hypothetical protein
MYGTLVNARDQQLLIAWVGSVPGAPLGRGQLVICDCFNVLLPFPADPH